MPTILGANTLSSGYDVENSLRFDGDQSDSSLDRQISGVNTTKFTLSFWTKYTGAQNIGSEGPLLFSSENNSSDYISFQFNTSNQIDFQFQGTQNRRITNRKFRDPSGWYHIVVAIDTTQGTAANRLKIYVNGVQETSFGTETTNVSQSANISPLDETLNYSIGRYYGQSTDFCYDGHFAEFAAIYGSALDPTSFGEFDSDSPTIWKPKDFKDDVTFGSNGFYLEFKQTGTSANSSGLGADTSGNDNHFTPSNLAAIDQTVDTCTNNFATWNSIADNLDVTLTEGNTRVIHGTQLERRPVISTFGVSKGKWYWEWKNETSSTPANIEVGIVNYASPFMQGRYLGQSLQLDADFTTYVGDGNINMSGTTSASGTTYTTELIGVAVDMDNERIYFYKNNTLVNSGGTDFSGMETGSGFIFMANADRSGSSSYTASVNFGNPNPANAPSSGESDANGYGNFEYAPPSGYYALCTKNIAEFG